MRSLRAWCRAISRASSSMDSVVLIILHHIGYLMQYQDNDEVRYVPVQDSFQLVPHISINRASSQKKLPRRGSTMRISDNE
jgi:hypothetical protein